VDGLEHDLRACAPVSYKQNSGEASFRESGSDVVFRGNVNVIQLCLLDVMDSQFLLFGLHSAAAVFGSQRPATGKPQILPEGNNISMKIKFALTKKNEETI
jgi:hypothetical protein